jgi:hypothetical protein
MNQKQIQKDHGKELYHTVIFLITLLSVLWYLNV